MDLHVRYEGDDDPEKCSARKLARLDLATLHRSARATPPGIVLDPFADRALSPADAAATAASCWSRRCAPTAAAIAAASAGVAVAGIDSSLSPCGDTVADRKSVV